MCSTHADRSILHVQIDLSGCLVCVAHIQIFYLKRTDRSIWMCSMCNTYIDRAILHIQRGLSGCIVCVAHVQIDLSYTYR